MAQWKQEIVSSTSGETQIDIANEFASLFADNLVNIAFGEDMTEKKFEFEFLTDKDSSIFITKSVNIVEALNNLFI